MSLKDIRPYKGKRRTLLNYLLNPDHGDQTVAEICRNTKVSSKTYYKYTNEPEFNKALIDESINAYARHLPQTATSVIKAAKRGDMRAAKLLHETLELVGRQANQTVNIANAIQDDKPMEFDDTSTGRADALAYIAIIRKQCDDEEIRINTQARQAGDAIHRQPDSPGHEEA